ncbi:MAG TPA: trehalose-phosphatase [Actinocrinis sp.]|nr:trehalose-phosphatase [Actinocrinis sp.]
MELTIDEAVAWTGAHLADCGFFFDFDGTLAPIQDDPEAVQAPEPARAALAELGGRARRVAVVSARPVGFLAGRLGTVPGLELFGLYGLESSADGGRTVATLPAAEPYAPIVADVVRDARKTFPDALVEDKRLACALHFRTTPQLEEPILAWAAERAGQDGLRIQHGRRVVELKPPVDWDKGAALRAVLPGLTGAWYFGDDLGDLPAFAALDLAAAGTGAADGAETAEAAAGGLRHGFGVAVTSPESDPRLIEQTRFQIHGPERVPALLQRIIAAAG